MPALADRQALFFITVAEVLRATALCVACNDLRFRTSLLITEISFYFCLL
jgi:hypothetical protein